MTLTPYPLKILHVVVSHTGNGVHIVTLEEGITMIIPNGKFSAPEVGGIITLNLKS